MIDQTFDLTGPADLDISVPAGSLTVEPGPDGRVSVTIDTKSPDSWRVVGSGNSISVSHERTFSTGGRARVRVVAPAGSSLKAGLASAGLRATLPFDTVSVATASGDVVLADTGTAAIKTASGDVRLGTVSGALTVRSASGDVHVDRVTGTTAVTTASGDVTVDVAAGELSSTSASGDLRVTEYLGHDFEASTMSGRVDLGLPSGISVKLSATSLSGKVHLPERRPATATSDRQVSVRLKSVSGDLRIRRIDSP